MTKLRKLLPVGPRLLVKLKKIAQEAEIKSSGGIIIESKTKSQLEKEQHGTQEAYVVEIGNAAFKFGDEIPWCKKGDCILISKYSGVDRRDIEEGEIHRVIMDTDVLCIFEDENIERQ